MDTQRVVAAACLAFLVSGCTTLLQHERVPYAARPAAPGLNYFLPRQVYSIVATYELKSCPAYKGPGAHDPLVVSQSVSISEASVADRDSYYSIPLETLASGWKTTSLSATFYDNQTLHTVGATADDRTAGIAKGVVGTALSIARVAIGVVAAAQPAPPPLCREEIYRALDTMKAGRRKLVDPAVDEKTRAAVVAAMASAQASLQFQQTYRFEPVPGATSRTWPAPPEKLGAWFANPSRIGTASGKDDYEATMQTTAKVEGPASDGSERLPPDWAGKGVLYREPAPVTVIVCAGGCEANRPDRILARLPSLAGQFGRDMVVPLRNGPFQKNNISLVFAPNGRLENLVYGKESRLEQAATALSETSTSVEGVLTKRRLKEEEDAKMAQGAELAAIKADTELLEAKAARIAAARHLIELGEAEE